LCVSLHLCLSAFVCLTASLSLWLEQHVDELEGSFTHWFSDDRIAHLIVGAFSGSDDSGASEDLAFALVFFLQRSVAFVITVVVVADVVDTFGMVSGSARLVACFDRARDWAAPGEYKQAAPSDDDADGHGGSHGGAGASRQLSATV
jgi:hypothetical protein